LCDQTAQRGLIDPAREEPQADAWGRLVGTLLSKGLPHQAKTVVLAWYDRVSELQAKDKHRYHKGTSAHNCGLCHLILGELPRAAWFFTLAFIEDVMTTKTATIPITPASQTLRFSFNRTDTEMSCIAAAAVKVGSSRHPQLAHYPEATLVEVARAQELRVTWAQGTEIPINRSFLRILIKTLEHGKSDEKKKSLEFLASYLAITLPSVRIQPNAMAFEHEMDLIVTQHTSGHTYLLDALGRDFLVECKNWVKPVGVEQLNHFVAKMRFHRCKCGVIFSSHGLSGDRVQGRGLSNARLTQLRWYQQDECIVIVVTESDLKHLATGSSSFADLLLRGYESVKFGLSDRAQMRKSRLTGASA
jgi:hypothetical protein